MNIVAEVTQIELDEIERTASQMEDEIADSVWYLFEQGLDVDVEIKVVDEEVM